MALSSKEKQDRYRATEKGKTTRARCFKSWFADNREKRNAYMRNWLRVNKDRPELKASLLKSRYKRRYGITPEQYDAMLAAQDGHCALCSRTPEQERYRKLSIDHDHQTGAVRGLLCARHNTALGTMGDTVAGLLEAIVYLTRKPKLPHFVQNNKSLA